MPKFYVYRLDSEITTPGVGFDYKAKTLWWTFFVWSGYIQL